VDLATGMLLISQFVSQIYKLLSVTTTSGIPTDFRWKETLWIVATHIVEQNDPENIGKDLGILMIGRSLLTQVIAYAIKF